MSRARCTLKVVGLDCAVEMEALRSALEGLPGVLALGFDLIHGSMTVDYQTEATGPADLIGRVARAGMSASLLEESGGRNGWWEANGRWVAIAASGLALGAGVAFEQFAAWPLAARGAYLLAIAAGGYELVPRGIRGLVRLRFDIHVLMAAAVAGALALGQWDE